MRQVPLILMSIGAIFTARIERGNSGVSDADHKGRPTQANTEVKQFSTRAPRQSMCVCVDYACSSPSVQHFREASTLGHLSGSLRTCFRTAECHPKLFLRTDFVACPGLLASCRPLRHNRWVPGVCGVGGSLNTLGCTSCHARMWFRRYHTHMPGPLQGKRFLFVSGRVQVLFADRCGRAAGLCRMRACERRTWLLGRATRCGFVIMWTTGTSEFCSLRQGWHPTCSGRFGRHGVRRPRGLRLFP